MRSNGLPLPRALHCLAVIAALAAALALAGCGRKGPLDPPPMSSNAVPQASVEQTATQSVPGHEAAELPSPQGQKKPILLDGLLN